MEGLNNTNNIENFEKEPKRHYTYSNIDIPDHPTIFECDVVLGDRSDDEMNREADEKYFASIGVLPNIGNHISRGYVAD